MPMVNRTQILLGILCLVIVRFVMWDRYNDSASKKAIIDALRGKGYFAEDNTVDNQYAVDLVIGVYADLEHREVWEGTEFPFNTIHIPYRKKKFIEGVKFKYIVLNKDYSYCLICEGEDILKAPVAEVRISNHKKFNRKEFEEFYNVQNILKFSL